MSPATPAPWSKDDEDDELGPVEHSSDFENNQLRTYQASDSAGNIVRMLLHVHSTRRQIQARVVSLQYNAESAIAVTHNAERFEWIVEGDGGSNALSHLIQRIRVGTGEQREAAEADFNSREDLTRIEIQKRKQPELRVTLPGLVPLLTETQRGLLTVGY